MADNSALHIVFQCSEDGERNLIKCMNHVNKQTKVFFTLRPCCKYFSNVSGWHLGTWARDMDFDEFEVEEEFTLFYGTVEDDLEIEYPGQQPKCEVPGDTEEFEEDESNQNRKATKDDTESEDSLDSMYDADNELNNEDENENLEHSEESEEDPDDEPEDLQEGADDEDESQMDLEKALREALEGGAREEESEESEEE
ncbi:hypothetical protein IFR05_011158 [Cadophora sp. M221]|nr:hypothetical protein IFR05_011158 [Cadophora sp. M221]